MNLLNCSSIIKTKQRKQKNVFHRIYCTVAFKMVVGIFLSNGYGYHLINHMFLCNKYLIIHQEIICYLDHICNLCC